MATYGVKLERSDDLQLEVHPSACSEEDFAKWCNDRIKAGERLAIDLFSGAGGLSLGVKNAGWTIAAGVDSDPKALQTHQHNFGGLTLASDLSSPSERTALVKLLSHTEIDLVSGGPPCQPFSRAGLSKIRSLVAAGHRSKYDGRRELWKAFLEIAITIRPRAVLMENVPDMALGDDFRVVRLMLDAFEQAGYYTQIRLVDAWRYGVPQHRKRLILLARRDVDAFSWPDDQAKWTTLSDAIGDLPRLKATTGGRELRYGRRKVSAFAQKMREGISTPVVWDHMTRPVRDDDRQIFEMMTPQTLYADIPEQLRRYTADTFDDKYKRLGWDELSRSITAHIAKDGYWYIHPEEARTLTVREAARIQTFPDSFRFAGTRSDAFRQIGNAVPPTLAQAAATALSSDIPPVEIGATERWTEARRSLTAWAIGQRDGANWYVLPGPNMTTAVAVVAALVLGHATVSRGVEVALSTIRGRERLTASDLANLRPHLNSPVGHSALTRLSALTRRQRIWTNINELSQTLALKPAQDQMLRLLCGLDILLSNQSVVRVAARVAGSTSDRFNRLTDGRVDVARLAGGDKDAALRVGALRLLGATTCTVTNPSCETCPLQKHCSYFTRRPNGDVQQPTLFSSLD